MQGFRGVVEIIDGKFNLKLLTSFEKIKVGWWLRKPNETLIYK